MFMLVRMSVLSSIFSLAGLLSFGTWAFRMLEDWTWIESFYFSVSTLTTVGYGDIHPTSDATRMFTAIYMLIGVGIVIAGLTSLGAKYLQRQEEQLKENLTRRLNHTNISPKHNKK